MENFDKAETHFRDSLDILQQIDSSWYEVRVRRRLADFLYEQGKLDEAVTEAETAIKQAEAIDHPDLEHLLALLEQINAAQGKAEP
jgi:hypothetical protein